MNTEHPALILERFLALLRNQEEALEDFRRSIAGNTCEPAYVAGLEASIEEMRLSALSEAATAGDKVRKHGVSIHDRFISDAMEVIGRPSFDKSPKFGGVAPCDLHRSAQQVHNPTPADLVYVGPKLEVVVPVQEVDPLTPPWTSDDTY